MTYPNPAKSPKIGPFQTADCEGTGSLYKAGVSPLCASHTRRLWSLWDMLQLKSEPFIRCITAISAVWGTTHVTQIEPDDHVFGELARSNLQRAAKDLVAGLQDLEAPITRLSAQRFYEAVHNDPAFNAEQLRLTLNELLPRLVDELGAQYFLVLNRSEARLVAATTPIFGPEVEAKLPECSEDIVEASKCAGCGRYTACVFHLMRVLEAATSRFAGLLNIQPINSAGKDKNWQVFLNEINKKIGTMPQQDAKTKKYAAISANLYNVKLAWRNEVMHPKQTYTEEETSNVWVASRGFMKELASVL
jgi:hypothetical protein